MFISDILGNVNIQEAFIGMIFLMFCAFGVIYGVEAIIKRWRGR